MMEVSRDSSNRRGRCERTPTTINDLLDIFDIKCLIFKRINPSACMLNTVFPYRLVSQHWNGAILQLCTSSTHLNLKVCCVEDAAVEYDTELINYTGDMIKRIQTNRAIGMTVRVSPWALTPSSVDFLLFAFWLIQSITIEYNGCSPEDGVSSLEILLRQLPVSLPQLEGFTFWYIPKGTGMLEHSDSFLQLYNQLNASVAQMTSLKRLNICVDSEDFNDTLITNDCRLTCLNVLPQLEQFGLNVYVANLDEVIAHLNPRRLTHLSLDCVYFWSPEHIERLFRVVNPGLTRSVTHLQLNHPVNPKHLMMFCSLFANSTQQLTIAFYCTVSRYPGLKLHREWFQEILEMYNNFIDERPEIQTYRLNQEINMLAVINHDTMKALSRMSKLNELTLINCLLDPNQPANCVDLSLPRIETLTLALGGPFVRTYLYLIKANLEAIRHIEYNQTSVQEFYAILNKHFPNLKKLTIGHTNQPNGPDALPRNVLDPFPGPFKDILTGGYHVTALHKSHFRIMPGVSEFTARLGVKFIRGRVIRNMLIANCDINNRDSFTVVHSPVELFINIKLPELNNEIELTD